MVAETLDLLRKPALQACLPADRLPVVIDSALRLFGETNDLRLAHGLGTLYERYAQVSGADERRRHYLHARQRIELGLASFNLLMPFWLRETSRHIVASAVIDYLMMRPVLCTGSLVAVDELVGAVTEQRPRNNGAVLGGLLLTGDRRVMERLRTVLPVLQLDAIDELARTQSGMLYTSVVDLYIESLHELADDGDDERFGALAAGLINMVRSGSAARVLDVARNFGLAGDAPPVTIVEQHSFESYRSCVLPRLEQLADKQVDEQLMPAVINAWSSTVMLH